MQWSKLKQGTDSSSLAGSSNADTCAPETSNLDRDTTHRATSCRRQSDYTIPRLQSHVADCHSIESAQVNSLSVRPPTWNGPPLGPSPCSLKGPASPSRTSRTRTSWSANSLTLLPRMPYLRTADQVHRNPPLTLSHSFAPLRVWQLRSLLRLVPSSLTPLCRCAVAAWIVVRRTPGEGIGTPVQCTKGRSPA